jgi:hypothetical protein
MSKLKAILLTAIIGSSSAAMAQPTVSFTGNARAQLSFTSAPAPVIRDHGYGSYTPAPAYEMPSTRTSYITLASALDLSTGRDVVRLQQNLRNADSLMLRVNSGTAFVQKVQIRFQNGSTQNVAVNAWMSTRNTTPLSIDLSNNRRIDSITIVGSPSGRVSYQLFAQSNQSVELPHPQPMPPVYQPVSLTGVYASSYGDVVLSQSGNHITGTCHYGTIDGTISGNVISFRWAQPGGSGGAGVWTIDGNGHLSGSFGGELSATNGGAWDLTRTR